MIPTAESRRSLPIHSPPVTISSSSSTIIYATLFALTLLLVVLPEMSSVLMMMTPAAAAAAPPLVALSTSTLAATHVPTPAPPHVQLHPHVDLSWYPPSPWLGSNLSAVVNGTGVYGFIFNSSDELPPAGAAYGYGRAYNWCNMPHVRLDGYVRASLPAYPSSMKSSSTSSAARATADSGSGRTGGGGGGDELVLKYVELIHRHHKRTPYASNTFPREPYPWSCNDTALYGYGAPLDPPGNASARAYRSGYASPDNPFAAPGFPGGSCEFPQLTRGGLDDAWAHGRDLAAVYRDELGLLPADPLLEDPASGQDRVVFRVTNNVITSQVAGMVLSGMFGDAVLAEGSAVKLLIQPDAIDSLEPTYPCPAGAAMFGEYGVGSRDANWTAHLNDSSRLFEELDRLSGVDPGDAGWHQSWDHYFDNLSARQCHAKPLPCNDTLPHRPCVTQELADRVYRLGEWEYSYIYRAGGPRSLAASVATYGVWIAELSGHLAAVRSGEMKTVWWHNVAHDGSLSRLLSILQVDKMVWPGMGGEVVFELYSTTSHAAEWYVRVLWGGQVLTSSNPSLGRMDLVPLDTLLAYFTGLVGQRASLIPGKCS